MNRNPYDMLPEEKRQYLLSFPVNVFYEAFKMAGGKLPVGRPPNDATDIIYRAVSVNPSIANATISRLQRLFPEGYRTETLPNEWDDPIPMRGPEAPVIAMQAPTPTAGTINAASVDLEPLTARVSSLESWRNASPDEFDIKGWIRGAVVPVSQALADSNSRLTARIDALEKKAPIIIQTPTMVSAPISGQHFNFPRMVKWLTLGDNVMLIGPAGTGKTTAAIAFSAAINRELYSQPLSLDSSAVLGFVSATGEYIETEFYKAWTKGGVFLWDEISMSAADAVGSLNAALANGFCSFPGKGTVKKHPDFLCICGDNSDTGASLEYAARTLLDGASLNRFRRIDWPVDKDIEADIAGVHTLWLGAVRAVREFIRANDIAHVGATMRDTLGGAKALSSGLFPGLEGRTEVLEDILRKGVLVPEWPRVLSLPAVSAFLRG